MAREYRFTFNVLIRKEGAEYVAYCLELGLIAVADSRESVEKDIMDVIKAHVRYAVENDNLEYMYHPAPKEIWDEFFACDEVTETSCLDETISLIEARKCFIPETLHA
jgi:predicted RNase H-like HicB family nuclease